jgi:S1-C subfamily serine protease
VRFVGGTTEWGRGVSLEGFLQTDGGPFPGFTGAAVVDPAGSLVGFVTENRSGNGGFVVSAPDLARIVSVLLKSGTPKPAWLGVSTRPTGGQGLVLLGIDSGSPADKAGWKTGDLLLSMAGEALQEPADLVRILASLEPNVEASARFLRNTEVYDWPVTPTVRR